MGRHKQVSDETVLQAAREVFSENGFGASTREIARQAGVSEAVLYQRHKTKLDLFFAAMIPPPLDLGDPRRPGRKRGFQPELEALALRILAYFRDAMPVLVQLVTHPGFNLDELADGESRMPLHRLADAVMACGVELTRRLMSLIILRLLSEDYEGGGHPAPVVITIRQPRC